MKQWVTGSLIGVLATGLLWLSWSWWSSEAPSAARAIPSDAIATYKGTNLRKTYQHFRGSNIAKAFKPARAFQDFNRDFHLIDSLLSNERELFRPTRAHPLYASLHNTSVDELGLLFAWQSGFSDPLLNIQQHLDGSYPSLSTRSRQFRSHTVLDIMLRDQPVFSLSAVRGVLIASSHAVLVEDGLRQFSQQQQPPLNQALARRDTADALFVNFRALPSLFGAFANNQGRKNLQQTTTLPGYARYHVNIRENNLQLTGDLELVDSSAYWDSARKPSAEPRHFAKVAPAQTAFLHAFALPGTAAGITAMSSQLKDSISYQKQMDSLEARYGFELRADFLPLLGNQLAIGVNEPFGADFRKQTFGIIHYPDTTKAFRRLRAFTQRKVPYPRIGPTIQKMSYRGHQLRHLSIGRTFRLLFGPLFHYLEDPFFTVIEDCVVLAREPALLKRLVDGYEARQTLEHTKSYARLEKAGMARSQHFTYLHPGRARQLPLSYLSPELEEPYRDGYEYYAQFSALTFAMRRDSNSIRSRATLLGRTNPGAFAERIWKQALDTTLSRAPEVIRHPETGNPELLLTDKQQQLYRMDEDGAIRWKKSLLTEKMGAADTIDLYQSGGQQYLFATRGRLHLLNHDGQEMPGFPLSLSAPAVTEVRTYTYAGMGDYRYFVGCQNNRIYGYQGNGSPLAGWSPVRLDAPLAFPVQYFRYRGKLRLFGVTEQGTLYLWNSAGILQQRQAFQTAFTHNFSMHFGATDSTTYLVSTDTAGKAHLLYLNGQAATKTFGDFGNSHHFLLADLNADGAESLIFAQGRKIEGYLPDSVKQFSVTLQDSIASGPAVYRLKGEPYLGYGSAETDRIFLIDWRTGKPYKGFPLKGNTLFRIADMNQDGRKELITGGRPRHVMMYQIQ